LSTIAGLGSAKIESLADLLRKFNHQNDVTVAYKAFYHRLARPGFAKLASRPPSLTTGAYSRDAG
jgi:hypothetical protein